MRPRTLRRALLARTPQRGDDRGSIPLLMLVIIVSSALGAVLMTSVINQSKTTRYTQSRVHTLHAAQTGLDVVLAQIRSAADSDGTGDYGALPCGPWSGAADLSGSTTYTATVSYYATKANLNAGTAMTCTSAGPFDPATNSRAARYALLTSNGKDDAAASCTSGSRSHCRTLQGTYVFQTNDQNIVGGQIRIYPGSSTNYCMDAGSGTPAVGTAVLLQVCSTSNPPPDQQVWSYRSDLSIELTSTATTSTPLCIDTNPTSHAAGRAIVLKQCGVVDASVCRAGTTTGCSTSPYNQQWSVDDSAHLQGANTGKTDLDGYCINVAAQTAGTALNLAACAGSVQDTAQTWVPSPTAGAGMAGAGNKQLVNYKQFAMCLDVTGQDVSAAYEILYSCKQNPNPANVRWNQKFTPTPALGTAPTKTLIVVNNGGANYCLKSPRTLGGYPVLTTPCPSSVAQASAGFAWTMNQKYSDSAGRYELSYADKYTIVDDAGLCLGLGANSDLFISVYYKATVQTCDGGTGQKWNADPSLDVARLTNIHE